MPSMTNRQSVAANATVANVFSAATHYRLKSPARVTVYASASAVGLNLSVFIGDETFLDDQEVSAQNRLPLVPDDLVCVAAGFAQDEIICRWRNTTAGALTGFLRVDVEPLAMR